jgi:hypothetical protein
MELTEKKAAELIIDHLLQDYPNGVYITQIVESVSPTHNSHNVGSKVRLKLLDYQLITTAGDPGDRSFIRLTVKGFEILSKMTFEEYQESLRIEADEKKERDRLTGEKLAIDVLNARRVYKSYWWTFGIALSGLIISIILLILRISGK